MSSICPFLPLLELQLAKPDESRSSIPPRFSIISPGDDPWATQLFDEPPSKKVCFACWALCSIYERRSQALTFKTGSVNSRVEQLRKKCDAEMWDENDVEFLVKIYSENLEDERASPVRSSTASGMRNSVSHMGIEETRKKNKKKDGSRAQSARMGIFRTKRPIQLIDSKATPSSGIKRFNIPGIVIESPAPKDMPHVTFALTPQTEAVRGASTANTSFTPQPPDFSVVPIFRKGADPVLELLPSSTIRKSVEGRRPR